MRVMMYHEADPDCPLVCFGQIVARDPFVLVGRQPNPKFRFPDLVGQRLAIALEVPTPWMTFQDDLSRAGVDLAELAFTPDAPMSQSPARLAKCEIDVAQVLEPYASEAVAGGASIWHRFATRGDIGYTAFYTTRTFLEANTGICQALLRGLSPALTAVRTEPAGALAAELAGYFPDVSTDLLTKALDGYRASGLWPRTPEFPPSAFVRLKAALLSGGLITRDMPFATLIANLEDL